MTSRIEGNELVVDLSWVPVACFDKAWKIAERIVAKYMGDAFRIDDVEAMWAIDAEVYDAIMGKMSEDIYREQGKEILLRRKDEDA